MHLLQQGNAKTDEYKLIWVVNGRLLETIFNERPRPFAVVKSTWARLRKTTHKEGVLVPIHKDDDVQDVLACLRKPKQLGMYLDPLTNKLS